jgi:uncharacterized protein
MPIVGVISDTHDQVHYLPKVVAYFQQRGIEALIHCGDWVSPFTLPHFQALNVPIYAVFGNNDGDLFRHGRTATKLGLDLHIDDMLLTPTLFEREVAIYHGTASKIVDALIKCGDYDAVFYGHNHTASVKQHGPTLAMNPGTLLDFTAPGTEGSSIGIYDPETNEGELIPLSRI